MFVVLISVAGVIASAICLFRAFGSLSPLLATLSSILVLMLSGFVSALFLARARMAGRREVAAGYSTLYDNDYGFERRDPRTGAVVEAAKTQTEIGNPKDPSIEAIVGGVGLPTVRFARSDWLLFIADHIGQLYLLVGLALEAVFVAIALDSNAVGNPHADATQFVSFCVSFVAAGVWPYFMIGNVFLRLRRASESALREASPAAAVWAVRASGKFSALVHQLPLPGTSSPAISGAMFLTVGSDYMTFWARGSSGFDVFLRIPSSRVERVALEGSDGLVSFPGVNVQLLANSGEFVELTFFPVLSRWQLSPVLARRLRRELSDIARGRAESKLDDGD